MTLIEKYRPKSSADLIISERLLNEIKHWLKLWRDGTPVKKALILHGPPGAGKTTTAGVLANELGVPLVEMNASDERNADSMKRIALMASLYGDLSSFGSATDVGFSKIILIDEADNIFEGKSRETGGDSGGLTELSKVIAGTKNPIILTMNDFYAFRRKSSARDIIENSTVIEFRQYRRKGDLEYKMFRAKLVNRIRSIANSEGLKFSPEMVDRIIDQNSDDIRSTVNDAVAVLSYIGEPEILAELTERDIQGNIYDIIHTTFKDKNYERTLSELRDKDFNTEDYLMWIDKNLYSEAPDFSDLASAYEVLSLSDMFVGRVLKKQHYAFKGYAEEIAAGIFTTLENQNEKYVKYEFPSFIMKMSRMRDTRGARKSLVSKLSKFTHSGKSRTDQNLWFYSSLARSRNNLQELTEKLALSEKEISLLKKR